MTTNKNTKTKTKTMTTRKAKTKERYTSMEDVLRSGKYKGRTIKEMLTAGNYISEAYHRGSIVMSRSLWLLCLDYKQKRKTSELEKKAVSTSHVNSYMTTAKRVAARTRRMSEETDDPCIHEACCCSSRCNHRNRTSCDQDIQHREGVLACTYSRNEDIFFNERNWE